MKQISDAPWIRDAELNGYPLDPIDDDAPLDVGDCPMLMPWLMEDD